MLGPSLLSEYKTWHRRSQRAIETMVEKYGAPNEVVESMLIWYNKDPWTRIVVHRDEVWHKFPVPHADVLSQTIEYPLTAEQIKHLAGFDGSLVVDQTRGELTAHCDSEAMNIMMLNLAHYIVIGQYSVDEARVMFGETFRRVRMGWDEVLAKQLQFIPYTRSAMHAGSTYEDQSVGQWWRGLIPNWGSEQGQRRPSR